VYDDGVIDEFPAFSFVIGDMHPHVMALPFLLTALAVVLETLLRGGGTAPESKTERSLFIAFSALSFGSFIFLNTWDILIFGMAGIAGWVGWRMSRKELSFGPFSGWKAFAARWALTGAMAGALFIPSLIGFSSQAGGILPNVLFPTKGGQFFVMFGTLLIPIAAWLILEVWSRAWKLDVKNGVLLTGTGWMVMLVGSLIMAFFITLNPDAMMLIQGALGGYGAMDAISIVLLRRLVDIFATAAPLFLIGVALAALLGGTRGKPAASPEGLEADRPSAETRWVDAFVLILVLWGALLILFPEYFYLRDFFGNRINTTFKFYFQGWAFLSLAAAYGVFRLFQRVLDKSEANNARWSYSAIGSIVVLATLVLGSVYFPMAVWTKTDEFKFPDRVSLDAFDFLQWSYPRDAEAISWILANIPDNDPFVEAMGNDYDPYASVVATHTGIPIVLGWRGHEDQWRGGSAIHGIRIGEIDELYRTTDWTRALEILEKYGIRYVYFGPLETSTYGLRGLDKFRAHLNIIYQSEEVVIFERAIP
jgi:YYY domain-containing protein